MLSSPECLFSLMMHSLLFEGEKYNTMVTQRLQAEGKTGREKATVCRSHPSLLEGRRLHLLVDTSHLYRMVWEDWDFV